MTTTSRREILLGLAAGAAVVPQLGGAVGSAQAASTVPMVKRDGRLTVNRERAYRLMKDAGLDAIVAAGEFNSRYLTNMRSIFADMGQAHTVIGVMPADPDAPIIAIVPAGFDIARHTQADREWPEIVTYSAAGAVESYFGRSSLALDEEVEARAPRARPAASDVELSAHEIAWQEASSALPTFTAASAELALRQVLMELGLQRGRVGMDEAATADTLVRYGWSRDRLVDAGNLFQKLRMVKSAVEIERMRIAARANADAARAMFAALQPGMTEADIQALFFAEVARRGGRPDMVVTGMVSGLRNGELVKNEPMLVDCVGRFDGYCGDFGRTLVFGTPSSNLEHRMDVLRRLVPAMFELVKPGVHYSELREQGAELVRKFGARFNVGIGPHSVGMQHTDDAARDDLPFRVRADTMLEAGMTITLDMPTIEPGWGSTHMESLILVTPDGAEWLDPYDDPLYELQA
ncbi:MAG: M24 family metallopeptidase [Gammaproteobacteria bacterium]|nr:M24 family metallopeptidase [Gammaproteobacteria bacterium]